MTAGATPNRERTIFWLLLAASTTVALFIARPYADGYNDGSRLGTVESLVDYHTFAFDRSIFITVPPPDVPPEQFPYRLEPRDQISGDSSRFNTGDKVFVGGYYYSDKPATQSVLLAVVYQVLQWTTGLRARENAPLFCYLMTLASSGVCFILLVLFADRIFRRLDLSVPMRLLLTASLALSTLALQHSLHVGAHICQLALAAVVFERLLVLKEQPSSDWPAGQLLLIGLLTGLCYALEQAAGGLLLGCVGLFLLLTGRSLVPALWYGLGTLPFFALHHGITYALAGTLRPINSFPEHFEYPGAVFGSENMTGRWNHKSLDRFFLYLGEMLFGSQGFLQFNLPLFLLIPGMAWLWRETRQRSMVLLIAGWAICTWLVYGALSVDYSGCGLSIRWFLPLLIGGYFLLALLIRDQPRLVVEFAVLSVGSFLSTLIACLDGPGPLQQEAFWFVQGATFTVLLSVTSLIPVAVDAFLIRWRALLPFALGILVMATGIVLYASEPRPVRLIEPYPGSFATTGRGAILLILGGMIGLLARADSGGNCWRAAFLVSIALVLAVGVFAFGSALLYPGDPLHWGQVAYLLAFDHSASVPTILSIIPVGLMRGIERVTSSWLEAWFLVSWIVCLVPVWAVAVRCWPYRLTSTASCPTTTPTNNPTT